jgi:hypothetical protein
LIIMRLNENNNYSSQDKIKFNYVALMRVMVFTKIQFLNLAFKYLHACEHSI